jgi:hypothetical protein
MRRLARFLLPAAIAAAIWLPAAPDVCAAGDGSLGFEMTLDVGHLGDYTFGDFAVAGAIQDEGSAFGQYVQMPDGTRALQLALSGQQGEWQLVIHDVQYHWEADWSLTLVSDSFTLEGIAGIYEGVTGSGSAAGYPYATDSWWSWGYPSQRESWSLLGELTAPLPPPPPAPLPELAIDDVSIIEGRRGTRIASFPVALSSASEETVSVEYATADGTALVSGGDYYAASGVVTFQPGDTTATIAVNVRGDRKREPDETFFVNLGNPIGAAFADDEGIGTILNDD